MTSLEVAAQRKSRSVVSGSLPGVSKNTSSDDRRVLAVGYNGNATGLPNSCDRDEPGNCGCLHSEENAIINCDAPRETRKIVYVTHLPCALCAKRLINLGNVALVYYANAYRSREGAEATSQ